MLFEQSAETTQQQPFTPCSSPLVFSMHNIDARQHAPSSIVDVSAILAGIRGETQFSPEV